MEGLIDLGYVLLGYEDFEFVPSDSCGSQEVFGFRQNSGYFRYIGGFSKIIIPDVIMGNEVMTYHRMFEYDTIVTHVANSYDSQIADLSLMFYRKTAYELNLEYLTVPNAQNTSQMFAECRIDSYLYLKGFEGAKIRDMGKMFKDCEIYGLDLSFVDLSGLSENDIYDLFYGNSYVEKIIARSKEDKDKLDCLSMGDEFYISY